MGALPTMSQKIPLSPGSFASPSCGLIQKVLPVIFRHRILSLGGPQLVAVACWSESSQPTALQAHGPFNGRAVNPRLSTAP